MKKLSGRIFRKKAARIQLLVLDVDGVLTDGKITFSDDGHETKSFDVRDGYGIVQAREAGIKIAIVSGRYSKVTGIRAKELKIHVTLQRVKNKLGAVESIASDFNIPPDKTIFIGDDVIDIPAMKKVGIGVAVADSHPDVIKAADWVTSKAGGAGAVREIIDILLRTKRP